MTFKQKLQNLIFPLGTIQKIRRGYLKGYKIRITENSLWSPIIGNWEPAMQKIMVNVVRENTVAYDLGANNGLHGLLLSRILGKKGLVINFEPLPGNVLEIDENFKMNMCTNYRNIKAAVSDKSGSAFLIAGEHPKQGHIGNITNNNTEIEVPVVTLDEIIGKGNPLPQFIKIDIEGSEGEALEGFSENIEKCFPEMVIELHNPGQDAKVGYFLKKYGYSAFRFDPFKRLAFSEIKSLDHPYPNSEGIWGTVFCIPPGKTLTSYRFES
ncbi:MAG: FkbM family methyltransferase [Ginsengibacter sp.]